jgi:hypothetical protein
VVVAAAITPLIANMINPGPPPAVVVIVPARPEMPSQPGSMPARLPSGVHCEGNVPGGWSRRAPVQAGR